MAHPALDSEDVGNPISFYLNLSSSFHPTKFSVGENPTVSSPFDSIKLILPLVLSSSYRVLYCPVLDVKIRY